MVMPAAAAPAGAVPDDSTIAPGATTAAARLARSPRHGEWVTIKSGPQAGDSLRLWVVYPQRSTKAPVVIVVHEIFGLSTWIRSVADQLAADGFIAIAPDFLTGKVAVSPPDTVPSQVATAAIRTLDMDVVQRQIDAAASYGMALPAALPRYGVVGFCWGGSVSFQHAVHSPTLGASVVYYGTSPASASLASVRAPVLGLYGGEDARVGATIPPADSAMRALGKEYTHYSFAGAGHGFLRGQDQMNGANLAAARAAWPMTIKFFRTNLER
jgi:carboxymethylenebutenolidase